MMMAGKKKPYWWPPNPYPEVIFPMSLEKYADVVPNPKTRTALSGALGREFWNIASKSIWDAMTEEEENVIEQLQADIKHLKDLMRKQLADKTARDYMADWLIDEFEQALKGDK